MPFRFICIISFFFSLPFTVKAQVTNSTITIVSYDNIKNLDAAAVILDVRTADEFKGGAINGATSVDFLQPEIFNAFIAELDPTTPIYLYCHSGGRSHQAAVYLQQLGFTAIFDYAGGYADWASKN